MNEILLAGCTPTPLANYLKALGVFRLVAEQKDPGVKACSRGERFVILTTLAQDDLTGFFLNEYRPTPILTPWNGRGGFLEGEQDEDNERDPSGRKGAEMVRTFTNPDVAERFQYLADSLRSISQIDRLQKLNTARANWKILKQVVDEKKKKNLPLSDVEKGAVTDAERRTGQLKAALLQELRNEISTESLTWFDACQIVSDKPKHAPLLGRGGLDGSMDFGVNFMQRLVDLFSIASGTPTCFSPALLSACLFSESIPAVPKGSIGQFGPGDAGGPNSISGFNGESRINPWAYILMLEGALMFLASASKRLESQGASELSYPFTVLPVASGSGATLIADEKPAGAKRSPYEIWLPLWNRLSHLGEIRSLFSEGRATLGRRPVKNGLGFARALAALGVDRGVSAFQRYGFLMRAGKTFLATPLGRMDVRPNSQAQLIDDLEEPNFLDPLRQEARAKEAPAGLRRGVMRLEAALFALTGTGSTTQTVQLSLVLVGEVMQTLAHSRKGQKSVKTPPGLSEAWILRADDDSAEFRIALALAAVHQLASHFAPVEWKQASGQWMWQPESRLHVWGNGDLTRNLVRIVTRRLIEAHRDEKAPEPFAGALRLGARVSDIHAFLFGHTDDSRIADLLQGLVWARMPGSLIQDTGLGTTNIAQQCAPTPIAYSILKPFFATASQLREIRRLPGDTPWSLPGEIPRLLAANQTQTALAIAWHRSRTAGMGWPLGICPRIASLSGPRLLAALTIPVQSSALKQLLPPLPQTNDY